jgi:hypothetical protein
MTPDANANGEIVYSHTTSPEDISDDDVCPWCHAKMTHVEIGPDGEITYSCSNPQCQKQGG